MAKPAVSGFVTSRLVFLSLEKIDELFKRPLGCTLLLELFDDGLDGLYLLLCRICLGLILFGDLAIRLGKFSELR